MPNSPVLLPKLNRLLSLNILPDVLPFETPDISSLISKAYIRNVISHESESGHLKYFALIISTDGQLGLTIPGTNGLAIVLNPPDLNGNVNEQTFEVSYFQRWDLLEQFQDFSLDNFSFSASDYYAIFEGLLGIKEEDIIQSLITSFVVPQIDVDTQPLVSLNVNDYFNDFIALVNSKLSTNIILPSGTDLDFKDLIDILNTNSISVASVVTAFIEDALDNLFKILNFQFPNIKRIKEIIIPQFAVNFGNLSLGIEFPRSILQPIDPSTDEVYDNPDKKSFIRFNAGNLLVSSVNGIEFEENYTISFDKSEILKTGFRLSFTGMKLDFSRTKNIPEATAAGYDDDFTGVFIETAEIDLPKKWFKKQQTGTTLGIYGKNLLIGTGGISGTLGLMATGGTIPADGIAELKFNFGKTENYAANDDNTFEIGFNYFDITFHQNESFAA